MHEVKSQEAFKVQWLGEDKPIRVNKDGYLSLNDIADLGCKRIDNWIRLESTKSFIDAICSKLNTSDVGYLKPIKTSKGKYTGGTWAIPIIAYEFASWVDVKLKIEVYSVYEYFVNQKNKWDKDRLLSSYNYKLLCDSIKDAHKDVKSYHYSNEANMINKIVFGLSAKDAGCNQRESATLEQLQAISYLESTNATLIDLGMEYKERKEKLAEMYDNKYNMIEQCS